MILKLILKSSLLLSFLTGVTLVPVSVFAQTEALGFSISPVIFDMSASPDQVWKSTIKVINANPYEIRLVTRVTGFEPQNESGIPVFTDLDSSDEASLANWISVPEVLVIPPEQTLEVPVVIYVPETAAPGGHFAAVLIGSDVGKQTGKVDSPQVATSQVISSLFFLSVTGEVSESAQIRSFRTQNYLLSEPATNFDLRLENQGNVHLQPTGEITIYNMWGQVRGVIPINKEAHFGKILPNSIRKYSYEWSSEWSIADIGWYRAKAFISYGSQNRQSLTAETSFLVLPVGWVLLTLIFVFGAFYLFIALIKLYIRNTLSLSGYMPVSDDSVTLTKRKKRLNFIAPLEAGLLDLRKSLEDGSGILDRFSSFFSLQKNIDCFSLEFLWCWQ